MDGEVDMENNMDATWSIHIQAYALKTHFIAQPLDLEKLINQLFE